MTDSEQQPTADERRFLESQGMKEAEPGRWVSDFQASDPQTREMLDGMNAEEHERLDLLSRSGRVQNEFELEQSGAGGTVSIQQLIADNTPQDDGILSVFVAVKDASTQAFEALDADAIERGLEDAVDAYDQLFPPDYVAIALRKLGVRCRAIELHPDHVYPDQLDSADYPGFRIAVIHFPGAERHWLDKV